MQGLPHSLQYARQILQHLMVPKPQHAYAARGETARALRVADTAWRGVVLGAINLDRQLHCGTIEIQHETCDGMLLAKAETVELFATEAVPQALLCVGHMLAQVARRLQEDWGDRGGSPDVRCPPPVLSCATAWAQRASRFPPLGGGIGNRVV
jgi:hypothetical protein